MAAGRSGDKGDILDLTLVAVDDASYDRMAQWLTPEVAGELLAPVVPTEGIVRYDVPGLSALKFVLPVALPGGVYASLRAGLHWQKAAIYVLLDAEMPG